MRRRTQIVIAAALALVAVAGPQAATPEARAQYRATLKRIAADQSKARALCRSLSGQPRRVCFAEADADAKKATAAAEAEIRATPHARRTAKVVEADANYAVARVKCGDKSGAERRECLRLAKAVHQDALADAMKTAK
jgi:hypothetical protein